MVSSASGRNAMTESRRHAILQAALKSFLTKGFTDTTMEDIRLLSGASTGSIYHHFENKEMLALALYLEGRNSLNAILHASMDTKQACEGIKTLVRTYLDWFEQQPDLGQYIIQAGSSEYLGAQVEKIRQSTDNLPTQLYTWLTPFIEAGSIRHYPQHLYVPLIIGPGREFVRRWLRNRNPGELQEAREPLAEAAWMVLSPDQ